MRSSAPSMLRADRDQVASAIGVVEVTLARQFESAQLSIHRWIR